MFEHIGFRVVDLAKARRFYDAAMAPLGLAVIDNSETSFLVGKNAEAPIPFLWIGTMATKFRPARSMSPSQRTVRRR